MEWWSSGTDKTRRRASSAQLSPSSASNWRRASIQSESGVAGNSDMRSRCSAMK